MTEQSQSPLFNKIDALEIAVPDLDAALVFYGDRLGHALLWRTSTAAGLGMPGTDAELVLQTERPELDVDLLVDSADAAAGSFERAGGRIVVPPFDIPIGRCVVVADPWGNRLVLLDGSKGSFTTDEQGNVTGLAAS